MRLLDRHALADGLQLGDALIAATALEYGLPLLTSNIKHFSPIEGLSVERFDPASGRHDFAIHHQSGGAIA